jgi:hypothetical protein
MEDHAMLDGSWAHNGMKVGFDGVWYWLMSFHAVVFLIFLLVTVIIGFDLYRELHFDRSKNRRSEDRRAGRLDNDEYKK